MRSVGAGGVSRTSGGGCGERSASVRPSRDLTFRGDHEAPSFARPPVHRFDDVDEFLLVVQRPVYLVVVSRAQVDHDVLREEKA